MKLVIIFHFALTGVIIVYLKSEGELFVLITQSRKEKLITICLKNLPSLHETFSVLVYPV